MNVLKKITAAATLAVATLGTAGAVRAEDSPVSVTTSTITCTAGTASLDLTFTNNLLTETGLSTLFALEYWVDGEPGIINLRSPDVYVLEVDFDLGFDYQLQLGAESDYFFTLVQVENPCVPQSRTDCQNGGWELLGFANQGACLRFFNNR